ncbi:MAG: hypothetical protein WCO60_10775 [Verrucomicrobiota bacterium]
MALKKLLLLSMSLVVASASASAADNVKAKVIDPCDRIDPRTSMLNLVKAKVVPTNDPDHRKALELSIDYAKPGTDPGYAKVFPAGMLNPKKYSAVRFWYRSDSSTGFILQLIRDTPRKDEKVPWFSGGNFTGKTEWMQATVPLENFKRAGAKIWKNGAQVVLPGGDPIDDEDYANIVKIRFATVIDMRGTSAVGHLMFDKVELIEK